MTDTDKLYGAIGFSQRAGKCVSGGFAVEKAVRGGKAKLVLLDSAASANTKDRFGGMCKSAGIPCLPVPDLGRAIGKPERMAAAVTDEGFAAMIANLHGGKS